MKILLVYPNKATITAYVQPIGLAYLKPALEAYGHTTKIVDLLFEEDDLKVIEKALDTFKPDIIGISIRNIDNVVYFKPEFYLPRIKQLIEGIRAFTNIPIILGGTGYSMMPLEILSYCQADYGIVGEGEMALPPFLQKMEKGDGIDNIPGLVAFKNNNLIFNPPQLIEDLNSLPMISREIFDPRYLKVKSSSPLPTPGILIKRGCPFSCIYCTDGNKKLRFRSPHRIAEELELMQDQYGIKKVFMIDDIFNHPPDYAEAICREIIKRKIRVKWWCAVTPSNLDAKLLDLMKKAGCKEIAVTIDSASEVMLQNLSKPHSLKEIQAFFKACKKVGMEKAMVFLLFGGPGENMETVKETIHFLEEEDPYMVYIESGLRIYPGTVLEKIAKEENSIRVDEDLLEPKFYVSRKLDQDRYKALLTELSRVHPNWISDIDWQPGFRFVLWYLKRMIWGKLRKRKFFC